MIWLELDPNVVKPGWTPLIITVLLGVVVVLLVANMRKQLRKINIPPADEPETPEEAPEETAVPDRPESTAAPDPAARKDPPAP